MLRKEIVLAACYNILDERIRGYRTSLLELTEGAESDSKSSAGDKHETSRAMMQQEQEKLRHLLQEAIAQKEMLAKNDQTMTGDRVTHGSLVKTDKGYLFVSIPLGKLMVDNEQVIVLSAQSPLGKQLVGLKTNEVADVNSIRYSIEEIM